MARVIASINVMRHYSNTILSEKSQDWIKLHSSVLSASAGRRRGGLGGDIGFDAARNWYSYGNYLRPLFAGFGVKQSLRILPVDCGALGDQISLAYRHDFAPVVCFPKAQNVVCEFGLPGGTTGQETAFWA